MKKKNNISFFKYILVEININIKLEMIKIIMELFSMIHWNLFLQFLCFNSLKI